MGSAEDDFAFRFVFQDKEEGVPKVMGSFTSQMGDVYNQKQADIWFGIGFFGTATPSGDRYDKTHDLICGTYEEIYTRDHFVFEASKRKMQQNKNGNPSPILITKNSLRQQPILKNKLLTHGNKTIHTEKVDDNTGKTHDGPQSRNTKLPLNPEGKIKHRTTSFLLPEDCVKEQKQVISEILESIESHNKEEHCGNDCRSTQKKNEVCCFSICKQTEQVNVTTLDQSGYSLQASGLLFCHMM